MELGGSVCVGRMGGMVLFLLYYTVPFDFCTRGTHRGTMAGG